MSIRGSNFENQHPFASDHALVWERCMPDGLLYGVDMSFTSTLFTLGAGFMLVAGRMFEITEAENISISPGSGYARVYVTIDTGGAATENSFDQVSFGVDYAATLDAFTELTQNEININQGAAVYQAEVAVLAIASSGATAIERQMELVSPGAGTGAFAAIAVTYPAGSTVTVTDGKITYTAPNTNGAALFIIPYAATWTVTATDGTDTASQTVEITSEGQNVSVKLVYALWLYKNGNTYEDVTGGYISGAKKSNSSSGISAGKASITYNEDNIYVSNGNVANIFYCENKIDLTDFDMFTFVGEINNKSSSSDPYGFVSISVWTEIGTYASTNLVASTNDLTAYEDGKMSLDVSEIEGPHVVGLRFFRSGNATINELVLK